MGSNKIRDVYDIHLMIKDADVVRFFECKIFEKFPNIVGKKTRKASKNNNAWIVNHPAGVLIFQEPEATLDKIKEDYRTSFSETVYGFLP